MIDDPYNTPAANTLFGVNVTDALVMGVKSIDGTKVVRTASSASLPDPAHMTMTTSHNEAVKAGEKRRRSLVRFDYSTEDSEGSPMSASAYLVIDVPTTVAADIADEKLIALAQLAKVLTHSGFATKFLDGES